MIEQIQRVLSPDLLKPQFRKQGEHPLYGHCYAASEALYHLLGGKNEGKFSGKSFNNILSLFEGEGGILSPAWRVEKSGHIWWKLRNHQNHFELIRSRFLKTTR